MGAGRFGEWLENNVDWALSRDRYWGTPLPVWVCDRDASHVDVVGSYAELAASGGAAAAGGLRSPQAVHRRATPGRLPSAAARCAATPEVIDTWFDSGAMPYAQWHYPFEHEVEFQAHFPADFICEGVDQTRGWFYSLLAIATTAFDSPAYRNVVVNDLVLDAEGQKMSKSKGNIVEPVGGDRASSAPTPCGSICWRRARSGCPSASTATTIEDAAGKFFNTLRNSYGFFALYAGDWAPGGRAARRPRGRWSTAGCSAGSTRRSTASTRRGRRTTPPTVCAR